MAKMTVKDVDVRSKRVLVRVDYMFRLMQTAM